MFYAKIWIVLLAVMAALAFGTALVVPKTAYRELNRAKAVSLDRVQHNTELILRLKSRHWLDAVSSMARDRNLIDVVQQANDRRGDLGPLTPKVKERLLSLARGLPAGNRPQLIIALDGRGKQIARVGPGENAFKPGKDGLTGFPLVEAALRGYLLDDTWNVEEKLYLMVASPVIAVNRGRYIGALLLGRELDQKFAQRLKSSLGGADVVFFLRGSIVASTFPSTTDPIAKLPRRYTKDRAEILKQGRSPAIPVGEGESAKTIIMAPFPGEASHHDAFYAVVGEYSSSLSFGELLGRVKGHDMSWSQFPWLLVAGGLVVLLVVGLGLFLWEVDLPIRRILHRIETLGKGEAARIKDEEFAGTFGSIARHLNSALDRAEKRSPPPAHKDIGRILGTPPAQSSRPELRMDPSYSSIASMPAPGVQPLEQFHGSSIDLPQAHGAGPAGAQPGGGRRGPLPPVGDSVSALSLGHSDTELSPSPTASQTPNAYVPEIPTFEFGGEGAPSLSQAAADSFSLEPSLIPKNGQKDEKTPAMIKVPMDAIDRPQAHSTLPPLESKARSAKQTAENLKLTPDSDLLPEDAKEHPLEKENLEEYFREVYASFVSIKQQCGESTSNLTFERFKAKLTQNRQNLLERYSCKSVKFQVYIKDGKAAIKATPVME